MMNQLQQPQMQGQQYPYHQQPMQQPMQQSMQPPMQQQPSQLGQQQGPQMQQMQSMQRPKSNMNPAAGAADSQGRQMMGAGEGIIIIFLINEPRL